MKYLSKEQSSKYRSSIRKGLDWYLSMQKEDGSFGNIPEEGAYYNTFYIFELAGARNRAFIFSKWARENIISSTDGLQKVNSEGVFAGRASYFKAWNLWGAHLLGIFDLSLKPIEYLKTYQHPELGGCYVSDAGRNSHGVIEASSTGMVGLAFLATGQIKEAKMAGDFLVDLVKRQPDWEKGLYGYINSRTNELITDMENIGIDLYGKENTGRASDDIDQYRFLYKNHQKDIPWANLGAPLFFLPSLYKATGDKSYLDAVVRIFDLINENKNFDSYKFINSSKVLWGIPLLYNLTADDRVFKACIELADYFCEQQVKAGGWTCAIGFDSFEDQPDWIKLAQAGDILLSLVSIVEHL